MIETTINDQLVHYLRDLNHTMRRLYEGRGSQKHILIVLDAIGAPITQRALTERLGIQPGSASEVIAKLESAGLITRTPCANDRRTSSIALTPVGEMHATEAREQRAQRHREMFACLSEEEKSTLLSLFAKLDDDWKVRYGR